MTLEDAEAYKASRSFSNEPNSALPENAHAFEDLTDFEVSGPFWVVASSDPSARTEYGLYLRAVTNSHGNFGRLVYFFKLAVSERTRQL